MRKRIFTIILALIFLFVLTPLATYADQTISVTVDGQIVQFEDQQPVIVDGRTLVTVRGVFETMGFDVDWYAPAQQALLTRGSDSLVITLGSDTFTANGTPFQLDVPAQLIGGRTMLPLRAVLESVGYTLDWDSATSTVIVTSGTANVPAQPEPTPEPEPTNIAPVTLSAGNWVVGQDVPVGRFVITAGEGAGSGNLFIDNLAGRSHVNEILNEFADGHGVPSVTVNLEDGYQIRISGLSEVIFTPAQRSLLNTLSAGHWIVGQDVPAGRFVITAGEGAGSGNLFIDNLAGRSHINEILNEAADGRHGVPSVTVDLAEGYRIRISGIREVVFTTAQRSLSNTLSTGHWVVGQDVPAGRFVITAGEGAGSGNLFIDNLAGRSHVNEILNEAADGRHGVPSVTVDLAEGYRIRISGIREVVFTTAQRSLSNTLSTGHWVVGQDVPAGRFVITAGEGAGSGNLFIDNLAGRSHVNEILNEVEGRHGVTSVTTTLQEGYRIRISSLREVIFTPAN